MKSGGDVQDRLQESEKLMHELEKTWEEKLAETERKHQVRNLQESYHHQVQKENVTLLLKQKQTVDPGERKYMHTSDWLQWLNLILHNFLRVSTKWDWG